MIGKPQDLVAWLFGQDRNKEFEVKEYRPKRSLTANAYAWALMGKIAHVLRSSPEEVYEIMLQRYGQGERITVRGSVDLTGKVDHAFPRNYVFMNGEVWREWDVFVGSSKYDTQEMSILIDGIISEAKELGIETLPPYEIERIKSLWKKGA